MVTIQGIDMSWLSAGLLLTICGMVIVFLVLLILIFSIMAFGKIMAGSNVKTTKKVAEKPAPVAVKKAAPAAAPAAPSNGIDDEIVAVIAAAVDAMYSVSGKKAVIRNIKPALGGGRSPWATAGVMQNVKSF